MPKFFLWYQMEELCAGAWSGTLGVLVWVLGHQIGDQKVSNTMNTETDNTLQATVDELRHDISKLRDELWQCKNRDVAADDPRVLSLLKEMYDTMVNNSSAHLWSNFVDSITGMPDLSTRKYSGTVTLTFSFDDVEIPGDIADWEIEGKILEEIEGDLCYGYEDETSVDYREED